MLPLTIKQTNKKCPYLVGWLISLDFYDRYSNCSRCSDDKTDCSYQPPLVASKNPLLRTWNSKYRLGKNPLLRAWNSKYRLGKNPLHRAWNSKYRLGKNPLLRAWNSKYRLGKNPLHRAWNSKYRLGKNPLLRAWNSKYSRAVKEKIVHFGVEAWNLVQLWFKEY